MEKRNELLILQCEDFLKCIETSNHSIKRLQHLIITLIETDTPLIEKCLKKDNSEEDLQQLKITKKTVCEMKTTMRNLVSKKIQLRQRYHCCLLELKLNLSESIIPSTFLKRLKKITKDHNVSNLL